MTMSSEIANKYFQGKENVAMAIARRRIKTGGDVKAALALIPITKPIFDRYRAVVETEYPPPRACTLLIDALTMLAGREDTGRRVEARALARRRDTTSAIGRVGRAARGGSSRVPPLTSPGPRARP